MKKNANLPVLIFTFALLIIWQAGAMGMNAAYILPSPTQILVRLWELRKPLFTAHLPATMPCSSRVRNRSSSPKRTIPSIR